ncbi:MAG TPA: hypothetical protein VLJ14_04880 [Ktedonobacterales bacterium]|nr:hypothetical protein [Ktedonobacterales bacterium]
MAELATAPQRANHTPSRRERRQRRAWIVALAILAVLILAWLVAFAPIGYANIAPPGWHNVTVHGNNSTLSYAVSSDTPGLMLACGEASTAPLFLQSDTGAPHLWRSRDGGQHWETLRPPATQPDCRLAVPHGTAGTFYLTYQDFRLTPVPEAIYITRDAGTTWQRLTSISSAPATVDQAFNTLAAATFRDGRLYSLQPPLRPDLTPAHTFVVSADDGATWKPTEAAPSAFERRGWNVVSYAPAYNVPHAWFRALEHQGDAPLLERSNDDGQTWGAINFIGSAAANEVTLATSPARPRTICAGNAQVTLLASDDGGGTWRTGAPPRDYSDTQGFNPAPPLVGADGSCYLAYEYTPIISALDPRADQYNGAAAIFRLAPGATTARLVSWASSYDLDFTLHSGAAFAYVPADNGTSARLVLTAFNYSGSPPSFLALLGGETYDNLLIWTTEP